MTKNERLDQLVKYYEDGNKAAFARRLGITANAFSMWYKRPTLRTNLILRKCIGVNPSWLLTGEGDMILPDAGEKQASSVQHEKSNKEFHASVQDILNQVHQEIAENNRFMREQMTAMQQMMSECILIMKKSQEFYERAIEMNEQKDNPFIVSKKTSYLAEDIFKNK